MEDGIRYGLAMLLLFNIFLMAEGADGTESEQVPSSEEDLKANANSCKDISIKGLNTECKSAGFKCDQKSGEYCCSASCDSLKRSSGKSSCICGKSKNEGDRCNENSDCVDVQCSSKRKKPCCNKGHQRPSKTTYFCGCKRRPDEKYC